MGLLEPNFLSYQLTQCSPHVATAWCETFDMVVESTDLPTWGASAPTLPSPQTSNLALLVTQKKPLTFSELLFLPTRERQRSDPLKGQRIT